MPSDPIAAALRSIVGEHAVLPGSSTRYLADATESQGLRGQADAICLPSSTAEVAAVLAWCYGHDVPVVPRGGGTGYAGGAVPDGGVVVALERLTRVRAFDPFQWRICVEAGVITADLRRLAREQGLYYPPDPGAGESSQIGGNIATNAGGPHAFKYGVTGMWVTGLEVVVPPGEVVAVGGPIRKDVAGYDLKNLMIGSEGTLGIVTAAWLRLVPAPEVALPVVAFYDGHESGCDALNQVLGEGLLPATMEYLDGATLGAAGATIPGGVPDGASFALIAEADGAALEAVRVREELASALGQGALEVRTPPDERAVRDLWRWREGVSLAVVAQRGGKISEDIVVPVERLGEAIAGIIALGDEHGLSACSWGHAGDGNLHATFMLVPGDADELARTAEATRALFELALSLGGSISGEHGIGWVKRGELRHQWSPRAVALHEGTKRLFDPKGLLNPGKKTP